MLVAACVRIWCFVNSEVSFAKSASRIRPREPAVAFEIAAKSAYRQTIPKAGPQLLEPIMKIDVFTPEDNVGVGTPHEA